MRKALTILIFFTLSAARGFTQHSLNYQDFQFNYNLTIDSVLSPDSVNYVCSVKSIKITSIEKGRFSQTVIPAENSFLCGFDTVKLFAVEDINFDSANDMRLLQLLPSSANYNYYYWIFNKTNRRFEKNNQLKEIVSPRFDKRKKLIFSDWSDGCCDHGKSTYQYQNNKVILIAESRTKQDAHNGSKYITTRREMVNGKMVVVKKTIDK